MKERKKQWEKGEEGEGGFRRKRRGKGGRIKGVWFDRWKKAAKSSIE